ncbi:MAG: hypothetical protein WBV77_07060 [Solirubrobacteraceae bacterium]
MGRCSRPALEQGHGCDPGGSLRELRPRAGRSVWRCIYERIGDVFVIGAVGPEAQKDKAGFDRAVSAAVGRLAEIERR